MGIIKRKRGWESETALASGMSFAPPLALEPRYMFDAAGVATGAEVAEQAEAEAQAAAQTSEANSAEQSDDVLAAAVAGLSKARSGEVIIIDSLVGQSEQLLAELDPSADVYVLDGGRDAVTQITEILADYSDLSAVHLISHGAEGAIQLGDQRLSSDNLGQYQGQLSAWGAALASGADFLLYGCDVATGEGLAFVSDFAELTGADVAASDDITGATDLGGDWDLEVNHGAVTTQELSFDRYEGSLQIVGASYNWFGGYRTGTVIAGQETNLANSSTSTGYSVNIEENTLTFTFVNQAGGFGNQTFVFSGGNFDRLLTAAVDPGSPNSDEGNQISASITTTTTTNDTLSLGPASGDWTAGQVITVNLTSQSTVSNSDPTISVGTGSFTENAGATPIDSGATVTDTDSSDFDTGTLTAAITANSISTDQLTIGSGVTVSGGQVSDNGTVFATITETSGTSNDGTVTGSDVMTFTFDTDATAARVQSLVRALSFENTSEDPGSSSRTITYNLSDGDGGTANDTATVSVSPTNDAPTITGTAGNSPAFTEGSATSALFSSAVISTVESGQNIDELIFTVTNVTDGSSAGADEVISFNGSNIALNNGNTGTTATNSLSYSVALSGTTATVTISGAAAASVYQDAINAMTYNNASQDPTTSSSRVVTLTSLQDNGGAQTTDPSVASTVSVAGVDDAPTLTATGTDGTFTEGNGSATDVFNSVTISTVEASQSIASMVFTVSNVETTDSVSIDGEAVALTNGNSATTTANSFGVSVSVSGSTATVTVTKTDSAANYQTLVDNLGFTSSSENPSTSNRVFTITTLTDTGSSASSNVNESSPNQTSTITVAAVNDAPVLNNLSGDSFTYSATDTSSGVVIDQSADATVTDVDSSNFDTGTLTVSISANRNASQDTLSINSQGGGAGQIGISGSNVLYSGSTIGSFTGGTGTDDLVITFNSSADATGVSALLKQITFANSGGASATANTRTVSFQMTDGDTGTSTAVDTSITVTANQNPVITVGDNSYTENAAGVVIDGSAATVTDSDSADFDTGTLTVAITSNANSADLITIGSGVTVSGADVSDNGTVFATISESSGTANDGAVTGSDVMTFTFDADATAARIQSLVRALTFSNTGEDPGSAARTVTYNISDGDGGTANDTSTISVTPSNDAPTITGVSGSSPAFTEGSATSALFSSASISTVESGQNIDELIFTVTNVADGSTAGADEVISFNGSNIALNNGNSGTTATNSLSYSVALSGTTATVTISGAAAASVYQDAINAMTYNNNSQDPSTSSRVVTLTSLQDNGGSETTDPSVASTVSVAAVNDEPTLTATGTDATFTEGDVSGADVFSSVTVSTVENGQNIASMVFTVTNVGSTDSITIDGEEVFLSNGEATTTVANSFGVSVSVTTGTATVTVTKTDTAANYQTLVDGLAFQTSGDDPSTSNRVFTITQLTDSGSNSSPDDNVSTPNQTSTITVAGVNDQPTLTATGSDSTFTEGDVSGADVFNTVSISTVESADNIASMVFTVSNVETTDSITIDGEDVALTNGASATTAASSFGVSVSVTGSTATVTVTKTDTAANYQTLVDGLAFKSSSEDPSTSSRVFTITTLTDSGSNSSPNDNVSTPNQTSTISVAAVNDEPTLSATGTNATFTEGDSSGADVFSSVSVSTVESGQSIASMVFTVTNVGTTDSITIDGEEVFLSNGESTTTVANSFGVSVSVTTGTATVTVTKTDTAANYQTLVDGLAFQTSGDDPSTSNRVFTITQLTDSGSNSSPNDNVAAPNQTSTITVAGVNDQPTLTATGTNGTFTEGDSSGADVFSSVSVSTVENADNIASMVFTVSNVETTDSITIDGEDVALTNGASATTVAGSFGVSVAESGGTATVTVTKTDTAANYQTLVDGLAFKSSAEDPSTTARVFTITTLTDSGSNSSPNDNQSTPNQSSTISVAAVNDEPTLTATGTNGTFTEGDSSGADVFSSVSVSTVESADNIASMVFTVTNVETTDSVTIDGQDVALTNANSVTTTAGSFGVSVSVTTGTATVTVTKTDSAANYQTLVDGLAFKSSAQEPSTTARVFTITSLTDTGSNSSPNDNVAAPNQTSTISLAAVNDEPTLSATGTNGTFTEGDSSGVDVFSSVSVSTVESADNIASMVFTVSNVETTDSITIDGEDVALTNGASATTVAGSFGISVTVTGGTATVTVTKTDTAANYQTLVDNLAFKSSAEDPSTSARVFTITSLTDTGSNSSPNDNVSTPNQVSTISVAAVNDEPTLTATGTNGTFTEGDSSGADVFSSVSISTVESADNIASMEFTVSNVESTDSITIDGQDLALTQGSVVTSNNSFQITVNIATGNTAFVNVTKTDTAANYQTLIDGLAFKSSSEEPSTTARVITITQLTDSGSNSSPNDNVAAPNQTSTISVASVDDEPTLTATGTNGTFTEGATSGADVFSSVSVSAVEPSQSIASMVFTVTNVETTDSVTIDGQDVALTNSNSVTTTSNSFGIAVSVSGGTATVTVTKTDSAANYQTLVDGLAFKNSSDNPSTSARVFTITSLTDTGSNTTPNDNVSTPNQASTISIAAVNDDPTLSNLDGDTLSYSTTTQTTGLVIDQGTGATVADIDSSDLSGGTLTVSISSGGANSEDVLSINNQGSSAGQISLAGATVAFGGTNIGTLSGGSNGQDLVVSFNSNATPDAVQALVRQVTFANASELNATVGARTVTFVVSDGDNGTSQTSTTTVNVTKNQLPAFSGLDGGQTFTEDGAAIFIDSNATLSDAEMETTSYDGGVLTVQRATAAVGTDILSVSFSGGDLTFDSASNEIRRTTGSVAIGSVDTTTTSGVLSISFDKSQTVTSAEANAVLRAVTFDTNDQNPDTSATFSYTFNDGESSSTGTNTASVTIDPQNDAPTITVGDASFTENGNPVQIDASATIGDSEENWENGSLSFSLSSSSAESTDALSFSNDVVISDATVTVGSTAIGTLSENSGSAINDGTVTGSDTMQVSLNGNATTNLVQTLVRAIQFQSTSDAPSETARVLNLTLTDGATSSSESEAATISVSATNDEPVLVVDETATISESSSAEDLFSNVTVSDADGTGAYNNGTLTAQISAGSETTDELSIGVSSSPVSINSVTGEVSISGVVIGTLSESGDTGDGENNRDGVVTGDETLTLTLNENATNSTVQSFVEALEYRTTTDNPSATDRTVSLVLTDAASASKTDTTTLSVVPVNDAPTISLGAGGAVTHSATGTTVTPVAVDSGGDATITDPDDTNFNRGSLTVSINDRPGTATTAEDVLAIDQSGQFSITGTDLSFGSSVVGVIDSDGNGANLKISFNESATHDVVTALIRSVTYQNNASSSAIAGDREVRFVLNDGTNDSTATDATVSVTVNQAPSISVGDTTYEENASGVSDANATASDPDTSTELAFGSGASLKVQITGNAEAADSLTIGGQFTVQSDRTVVSNGVTFATVSEAVGSDGQVTNNGELTVEFNNDATGELVQGLVRSIQYASSSDHPTANSTTRTVTYTLTDAFGAEDTDTATVTISPVNDDPVITGVTGGNTFTEDGSAVLVVQGDSVAVSDAETTNFNLATLTISLGSTDVSGEDVLGLQSAGTGAGQIGVSGTGVSYEGTDIGTFTGGSSGADLVISFNQNATAAAIQAVIQAATYSNTNSAEPTTTDRSVSFVLTDGTNGTSQAVSATVSVAGVADEPTLTATGSDPTFTEDGSAVTLFTGVTVDTVETGETITGFVITVSNVADSTENLGVDGARISLVSGDSGTTSINRLDYSVAVSGTTATVTFTGGAVAESDLQLLLGNMTYFNSSEDPTTTASRTISITEVTDSGANTGQNDNVNNALSVSSTVTVVATNDAPTHQGVVLEQPQSVDNGQSIDFTVDLSGFTDVDAVDNGQLTYQLFERGPNNSNITPPPWIQMDAQQGAQSGQITVTDPPSSDVGPYTFVIVASDGSNATAEATFDFTVTQAPQPVTTAPTGDQLVEAEDPGVVQQDPTDAADSAEAAPNVGETETDAPVERTFQQPEADSGADSFGIIDDSGTPIAAVVNVAGGPGSGPGAGSVGFSSFGSSFGGGTSSAPATPTPAPTPTAGNSGGASVAAPEAAGAGAGAGASGSAASGTAGGPAGNAPTGGAGGTAGGAGASAGSTVDSGAGASAGGAADGGAGASAGAAADGGAGASAGGAADGGAGASAGGAADGGAGASAGAAADGGAGASAGGAADGGAGASAGGAADGSTDGTAGGVEDGTTGTTEGGAADGGADGAAEAGAGGGGEASTGGEPGEAAGGGADGGTEAGAGDGTEAPDEGAAPAEGDAEDGAPAPGDQAALTPFAAPGFLAQLDQSFNALPNAQAELAKALARHTPPAA